MFHLSGDWGFNPLLIDTTVVLVVMFIIKATLKISELNSTDSYTGDRKVWSEGITPRRKVKNQNSSLNRYKLI